MAIRPPIRPTPGSLSPLPLADAKAPFAMKSVQQAGAEAFLMNLPTASCRFPVGSGQNLEWVRGWAAEQIRQRRIGADEALGALKATEALEAADPVRALLVPRARAAPARTRDPVGLPPVPIAPIVPDAGVPAGVRHGTLAID